LRERESKREREREQEREREREGGREKASWSKSEREDRTKQTKLELKEALDNFKVIISLDNRRKNCAILFFSVFFCLKRKLLIMIVTKIQSFVNLIKSTLCFV